MATMTERLSRLTTQQLQAAGAIDFCRFVQCQAASVGPQTAARLFADTFPRSVNLDLVQKFAGGLETKAAVLPGTTTDATWAGPLAAPAALASDFVGYVNQQTIVGRLPGVARGPFDTPIPVLTTGAMYAWTVQGKVKPISAMAFASATVPPTKAGGIIAVTEELLRARPGNAELLQSVLAGGLARFLDQQFMDPALAPVAGQQPGSITNGATVVTATGNLAADLAKLISTFFAGRTAMAPVLILPTGIAVELGLQGAHEIRVDGTGTVAGLPAIVSPHITVVAIVDAQAIVVADAGQVAIDVSRYATLQLNTTPDEPATASTIPTSLWQSNQSAIRAERFIGWLRTTTTAVAYFVPVP